MQIVRLKQSDFIVPPLEFHYALYNQTAISTLLHCHDFFEIFLIIEGSIIHYINGESRVLKEGTLVFIRPNDQHYFGKYKNNSCRLINVAFTKKSIDMASYYLGSSLYFVTLMESPVPFHKTLPKKDGELLKTSLEELNFIPIKLKNKRNAKFKIILVELFYKYFSISITLQNNPCPEWLEQLRDEMEKEENLKGGLSSMLRISEKTHEHLCRSFKKYYNKTPTEYLNSLRLNYTASLLINTDKHILDISLDAGFDNLSHFYHLFKKYFGISPADFRKLNKRTIIPISRNQ